MIRKTLFILLIIAIFFTGCGEETYDGLVYNLNKPDTFSGDDYEIYNLVANPDFSVGDIIIIAQRTEYVDIDTSELKEVDGIDDILI